MRALSSMSPVHINFASQSLQRVVIQTHPTMWLFTGVGMVLCIVATIMSLAQIEKNNAVKISLQQAQAQLAERTTRKMPTKKTSISDAQVSAINAVIQQLNLPWSEVLDAFEEATPATIAMLALEPDVKKHIIKGMAEAKSSGEMIAYIEELKSQDFFGSVALTKHEINEQDQNKPIRFQFEAQWKEPR